MKYWRLLSLTTILLLLVALMPIQTVSAAPACSVTYTNQNDWGAGATIYVLITNTGDTAYNGWNITWTFAGNQHINNLWNGTYTQSGQSVSVTNMSYNAAIPANGGSTNFGFNIDYTGSNVNPTSFSVNGATCGGGSGPSSTPSRTSTRTNTPSGTTVTPSRTPTRTNTPSGTTVTPSRTSTRTNTPSGTTVTPSRTPTRTNTPSGTTVTPSRTPTLGNVGSHLSNPFSGATWYVNPDWAAEVNASSVTASQKSVISHLNTAVWLDSIGSLNGTNGSRGLIGHLDAAVAQGANLIIIVVYDLPGRDCSALASNGELTGDAAGLATYKSQYIDVIAADIASKPAYANLRIIAVIEPDSLPNLVTNLNVSKCSQVNSNGVYVQGIQYALNKLYPTRNVYSYIDIGHAGWLGWPSNFGPAITLISNTIKGTTQGVNSVDGFIDNTANTQVEVEPYLTADQQVGGQPVRSATFFSYNDYIQENTFDAAWKTAMQGAQLPASSTNMLLDTSRNGWGGCGGGAFVSQQCRPTGPGTSTDLNTFVNQSRIDRRPAKGDWCNQNGAGLGKRPSASASAPYQAYVWIKPPGESDGSSSLIPIGPDNPDGKGFDQMCDPNYGGNERNQNMNTNALPNAPVSGRWFEAQFVQLVQNAFPAIP